MSLRLLALLLILFTSINTKADSNCNDLAEGLYTEYRQKLFELVDPHEELLLLTTVEDYAEISRQKLKNIHPELKGMPIDLVESMALLSTIDIDNFYGTLLTELLIDSYRAKCNGNDIYIQLKLQVTEDEYAYTWLKFYKDTGKLGFDYLGDSDNFFDSEWVSANWAYITPEAYRCLMQDSSNYHYSQKTKEFLKRCFELAVDISKWQQIRSVTHKENY